MTSVNVERLHRHLAFCQSVIDRLAPDEPPAWHPALGDHPEIPKADFQQVIAIVWTNLARAHPHIDYLDVVWALEWIIAPEGAGPRDRRSIASESRSAPPASPAPPRPGPNPA